MEPVPKALEVVTKELGYLRSPDYFEIVERKQLGVWTVPLVNSAIMFHQRVLQELADAMDAMMHAVQENPRFGDWFTIQSALCLHLRSKGIFSRVTNLFELGHLINAEDYDATRAHPDLFLVTANPIEWEQEYLNELYDKFAEYADVPNCHDVYQVPLFSPKFARELIEECEFFGQWSGGDHADERLDGGYEPVPTQVIFLLNLCRSDLPGYSHAANRIQESLEAYFA